MCMAHTRSCTHGCVWCVRMFWSKYTNKHPTSQPATDDERPLPSFTVYIDQHTHTRTPSHAIRMCVCVCACCVRKQTHVPFFCVSKYFPEISGERALTHTLPLLFCVYPNNKCPFKKEQYSHTLDENVDAVVLLLFGLRFSLVCSLNAIPKHRMANDVVNGVNEFEESNSIIR